MAAQNITLRRGIEEILEAALATTQSGQNTVVFPAEYMGARCAIQLVFSVAPGVAPTIPILASLDGVNFGVWTGGPSFAGTGASETQVVISEGIKAIKVGAVTFAGGGTLKVLVRVH